MYMLELLSMILLTYIQLIAIIDPFAVIPIYLDALSDTRLNKRGAVAGRISIVCAVMMAVFTLGGNYILSIFGISIPALRLGGGIILMAIAIDMLGGLPRTKSVDIEEFAVVPLASPLLVGPGTITTLLLFITIYPLYVLFIAIILASATIYILLRYAEYVYSYLGRGVVTTFARVMSIIVAAIAAQLILDALMEWYRALVS